MAVSLNKCTLHYNPVCEHCMTFLAKIYADKAPSPRVELNPYSGDYARMCGWPTTPLVTI